MPLPPSRDPAVIAELRRRRGAGQSIPQVTAETGWNKSTVHRIVRDMDIDARAAANKARATREPPPWLAKARAMIAADISANQAAKALGIGKTTMYKMLARFPETKKPAAGEGDGHAA